MANLTEKDKLQDMLNQEKEIVKVYGAFITEASTQELRSLFKQNLVECSEDQFCVFEEMQNRNYYSLKAAQPTEIMQEKTKFENMKTQLSENN